MTPATRPMSGWHARSLLLVLAALAAFVWLTSGALPDAVGSHFGPGGRADADVARGTYTGLMIALVIVASMVRRFGRVPEAPARR